MGGSGLNSGLPDLLFFSSFFGVLTDITAGRQRLSSLFLYIARALSIRFAPLYSS